MSRFSLYSLAFLLAAFALVASASPRMKRGTLTDDAERVLRQGSRINTNDVGQLVDLVERNRAQECLSRVICELSNDPKLYAAQNGNRFAQSLLKFRNSNHPKVKQYLDAMNYGIKLKSSDQCRGHYARCQHPTSEVVIVGNQLLH